MSRRTVTNAVNVLLLLYSKWCFCNAATGKANIPCGSPGKPANATLIPEKNYYSEGDTVYYKCPTGVWLFYEDSIVRTCNNGSWSSTMPFCNPNIAFRKQVQVFPTSFSMSDLEKVADDRVSSCLDLPPVEVSKKRRIRISLGKRYNVRRVNVLSTSENLNVKVFSEDSRTNKTEICNSHEGKVTNNLIRLDCTATSDTKGSSGFISGDTIIVEDNVADHTSYLTICDIAAYAFYGDMTDCGLPEAPAFGSAKFVSKNKIQYECQAGYARIGSQYRTCNPDGGFTHWPKDNMPICKEIEIASSSCSPVGDTWFIAFIFAATLAVVSIAALVLLAWKSMASRSRTQHEAVEKSPKATSVRYERTNDNVGLHPSNALVHVQGNSRSSSPIYEEIGSGTCSGNQKTKEGIKTCPKPASYQVKTNNDNLGLELGTSAPTYDNIVATHSGNQISDSELLGLYANENRSELVYQNPVENFLSLYKNM